MLVLEQEVGGGVVGGDDSGDGSVDEGSDHGAAAEGSTRAVFVDDSTVNRVKVRKGASLLAKAKALYQCLELRDDANPRVGYKLELLGSDADEETIGCAAVSAAERSAGAHRTADKAFHRACLKAALARFFAASIRAAPNAEAGAGTDEVWDDEEAEVEGDGVD